MSEMVIHRKSAIVSMADRLNVEPDKLAVALKNTAFKGATNEEMLALTVVANQYGLNPFLKQIYAFPAKGGGIVPIVSIDGWLTIINSHPDFDGCEFEYEEGKDGKPVSCTCILYRKGRQHPTKVTEYYAECFRPTEPWKMMPRRMLRHKALIQCARVAFSLGGIYDEDEGRTIAGIDVTVTDASSEPVEPKRGAAALSKRLAAATEPKTELVNTDTEVTPNEELAADAMNEEDAAPFEPGTDGDAAPRTFENFVAFQSAAIEHFAGTDITEEQVQKWIALNVLAIGKKGKESTISPETLNKWFERLRTEGIK